MEPDDEVIFGRALDESRTCSSRIESLRLDLAAVPAGPQSHPLVTDLTLAVAEFELHGSTLRTLAKWYPEEARIPPAVLEWERSKISLGAPCLE